MSLLFWSQFLPFLCGSADSPFLSTLASVGTVGEDESMIYSVWLRPGQGLSGIGEDGGVSQSIEQSPWLKMTDQRRWCRVMSVPSAHLSLERPTWQVRTGRKHN